MARPERFELPTAWFVVFRLSPLILLLFITIYGSHCPIKLGYVALFAYI